MQHFPGIYLIKKEKIAFLSQAKSGTSTLTRWVFDKNEKERFTKYDQTHPLTSKIVKNIDQWARVKRVYNQEKDNQLFLDDPNSWTKVRIVRNPLTRAVSSFLHLIYWEALPETRNYGCFLDFLQRPQEEYISSGDYHMLQQATLLDFDEQIKFDHVVKIENGLIRQLEEICLPHGISTGFNAEIKENARQYCGDNQKFNATDFKAEHLLISKEDIAKGNIPELWQFTQSPVVRQLIYRCYWHDFQLFDYDPELSTELRNNIDQLYTYKQQPKPVSEQKGYEYFKNLIDQISPSEKLVIYGGGETFINLFMETNLVNRNIIAIIDDENSQAIDDESQDSFQNFRKTLNLNILTSDNIPRLEFDKLLVCSIGSRYRIKEKLLSLHISEAKILMIDW